MIKFGRPQRIQPDIGSEGSNWTDAIDRNTESTWPEPPVPDDPREQRWIRNRLMVLAIAIPVARLLSLLFR